MWLALLDKVRPVVVLTRDPMGSHLTSVIVGPVTSTIRGLSTEVPVGAPDGLRVPSVVNLDNTQLVQRSEFRRRVGRVRPETMEDVCAALGRATGGV